MAEKIEYNKTQWHNGRAPAINANNLNNIENGVENATNAINDIIDALNINLGNINISELPQLDCDGDELDPGTANELEGKAWYSTHQACIYYPIRSDRLYAAWFCITDAYEIMIVRYERNEEDDLIFDDIYEYRFHYYMTTTTEQTVTGLKTFRENTFKLQKSSNQFIGCTFNPEYDGVKIQGLISGSSTFILSDSNGQISEGTSPASYLKFENHPSEGAKLLINHASAGGWSTSYLKFPDDKGTPTDYSVLAIDSEVVHLGTEANPSNENIYGTKTFKSGEVIIGSNTNIKMKISSHISPLATLIVSCTEESVGAPARLQLGTGSNSGVGILTLSNYTDPSQVHPSTDSASLHYVKGTDANKKEAYLLLPNVGTENDPKTLATTDDCGTKLYQHTISTSIFPNAIIVVTLSSTPFSSLLDLINNSYEIIYGKIGNQKIVTFFADSEDDYKEKVLLFRTGAASINNLYDNYSLGTFISDTVTAL